MSSSSVRFTWFPRTEPPPGFAFDLVRVFRQHEPSISTVELTKGLTSDQVLSVLRDDLVQLGFDVEAGKHADDKIQRPVFFGENGEPTLKYEVDAYHPAWRCGLEVEAGRAWMGNAVYRDLIQALVMVQVDTVALAVSNAYKYRSGGKVATSRDYDNAVNLAQTLYSHSRLRLPYNLLVIGY